MSRFLLSSHVQNARQSLRSSHSRTLLTILGIMIGVASITTILSLGGGASQVVAKQIDALGGNLAIVQPGVVKTNFLTDITTTQHQGFATSTLTDKDFAAIAQLPHVRAAAPISILNGNITAENNAPVGTPIVVTTPDLESIDGLKIDNGEFLDSDISNNTAVIGPNLARIVFGTSDALGKTVYIRGQDFTVIGILKPMNQPINYNNVDFDNAIIIDQEVGHELSGGTAQIQQINVRSDSVANLSSVVKNINKVLTTQHLGDKDFTILASDDISRPTNQLFDAVVGVTMAIATISLLVGGIGIMNILLVSVAERSREIGIRKAIGAHTTDIVWQFLIKSLALSISGGFLGYIAGYGLAFAISTVLPFDPSFTWQIAAVSLGVSVVIGTLFGLYPAVRAARKDPIEALRY